jgi:hypothetical protein
MFQMLVLAKGQTNLLRVPAGAARGGVDVAAGLGVPAARCVVGGVTTPPGVAVLGSPGLGRVMLCRTPSSPEAED